MGHVANVSAEFTSSYVPPVLITAPAYLLYNWAVEIQDFIPGARVIIADSAGREYRHQDFQVADLGVDFVLTSYNNWSQKVKKSDEYEYFELLKQPWTAYIFDEGHRLRGRNSSWTQHVFKTRLATSLNKDVPIWLLTGTPFVRDGGDFYPYFHLYDKRRYGSYWKFVNERCVVTENPWKKQVGNIKRAYAQEFREELAQFSLRRTVKEIPQLADLEFQENYYKVTLPTSVVKMIKKAKKEYVLDHPDMVSPKFLDGSGALYVAQRKIATIPPTKENPKLDWLKDFLNDKQGKVVVYTWYKDSARAVADVLGSGSVLVTGDVAVGKRHDIIQGWRAKGGPQTLVATIPSLKEGISLTEANDVVFLEHSELPADQEQCIKRLCRRGQKSIVQVHHVDADKSVDMVIKRVLADRNLGIQDALKKWIAEDPEATDEEWFE